MACVCHKWGVVIEISPSLRIRVNGETGDEVYALSNPDVTFAVGDKVALDRRGTRWVAAYKFS